MAENYSAFKDLNLSDARSENETREEYKLRKKRNNKVLKFYNNIGREAFQQMFPEGANYRMFEVPEKEAIKVDTKKVGKAK